MADSLAFDVACDTLENDTNLDRLEARGTVRIALKVAGLEPKSVTPDQLKVVAQKILPSELVSRGVGNPDGVCARLIAQLGNVATPTAEEAPESMFVRLGSA